jgi:hypothetical protein
VTAVGICIARVETDGLIDIGDRSIDVVLGEARNPAAFVRLRVSFIEGDGLVEIGDRCIEAALSDAC